MLASTSMRLLKTAVFATCNMVSILPDIPSVTYSPRVLLLPTEKIKTDTSMAPMISTLKNDMIPITRQVMRRDS